MRHVNRCTEVGVRSVCAGVGHENVEVGGAGAVHHVQDRAEQPQAREDVVERDHGHEHAEKKQHFFQIN